MPRIGFAVLVVHAFLVEAGIEVAVLPAIAVAISAVVWMSPLVVQRVREFATAVGSAIRLLRSVIRLGGGTGSAAIAHVHSAGARHAGCAAGARSTHRAIAVGRITHSPFDPAAFLVAITAPEIVQVGRAADRLLLPVR